MIETTEAKIGRSMKKCEIRMRWRCPFISLFPAGFPPQPASRRLLTRLGALLLRPHLLARPRLHQATDHNAIIGANAFLDDAQIVARQLTERDIFGPRGVLIVDDNDETPRLLGADCRIRHEQTLIGRRTGHAHAREHAGRENARSDSRTPHGRGSCRSNGQ